MVIPNAKDVSVTELPMWIEKVRVPPIKCQGIKTKLVPFIAGSIAWRPGSAGRWIEPFAGSGVVAFNIAPERAVLADTNVHIIGLYRDIQSGEVDAASVRRHLEAESPKLRSGGADYYYEVRQRFNREPNPLDFLFLNRSCFNGLVRFNRSGQFNVPFGHKPERFSRAYITKIVNQVAWVTTQMRGKAWEFRVADWRETLAGARVGDFVYLDPPYIGRHADYYNGWTETEAEALAMAARESLAGVALSMWEENRYRRNDHLDDHWDAFETRSFSHFYHLGATETLRNEMREALAIKPGFAAEESFLVPSDDAVAQPSLPR